MIVRTGPSISRAITRANSRGGLRRGLRRGLTLLEVVLAAALLGMVTAGFLGTLSAIWGWQGRQQEVLGAAEVANRMILTYLDDRTAMPSQSLPVGYGPYRYHWRLEKDAVKVHPPADLPPDVAEKRADRASRSGLDRIEHISVRAWLSEESAGGSVEPETATPQVMLERLVDPLAFRNPDAIKRMFAHPEILGATLSDIARGQQGGAGQGTGKDSGKATGGGK